jgi:hypothetical protein
MSVLFGAICELAAPVGDVSEPACSRLVPGFDPESGALCRPLAACWMWTGSVTAAPE